MPEKITPDVPQTSAAQVSKPHNTNTEPLSGLYLEPGRNEVWIWDNEYRPSILAVPLETTIAWTSYDDFHQHDVDCPGFFSSSLAFGCSFNYTFAERGIFEYQDSVFGMIGKIIVE